MLRNNPKTGLSGYEPGKGRTFTPSAGADWTTEFNNIMFSLNKSRNEMTEELIRDGILSRKGKDNGLSAYYSEAELEFLKSPIAQKLVRDYHMILNGSMPNSSISANQFAQPNQNVPKPMKQVEEQGISDKVMVNPSTPIVRSQQPIPSSSVEGEDLSADLVPLNKKGLEEADHEQDSMKADILNRIKKSQIKR